MLPAVIFLIKIFQRKFWGMDGSHPTLISANDCTGVYWSGCECFVINQCQQIDLCVHNTFDTMMNFHHSCEVAADCT